jgi:hypothetical protein
MKLLYCIVGLFLFSATRAQQKPAVDKSPLDVCYAPNNYPMLKMNGKTTEQPQARVIYSRPQKAGRTIFGGIVRYGEVWRVGANEATEIEFFKNVKIGGKNVAKVRYTLYAICEEKKWTIILNSEKDIWGTAYNQKKDVTRFDVLTENTDEVNENLTIYFEGDKTKHQLIINWDNVKVSIPVIF